MMPRVVLQVNENDRNKWVMVLHNIQNLVNAYDGKVEIHVVTYGPGIHLMEKEKDAEIDNHITGLYAQGVTFGVCLNTVKARNFELGSFLPFAVYHVSGVAEIIRLQMEDWVYLRP